MSAVCIITARGGSKRIPGKNIRPFLGKPILAYSIEAARKSGLFDRVMVSTDSGKIAEVARAYGAEVPFLRSEKTAGDFATTADVVAEVLDSYRAQGLTFDILACLYPTAPFVTAGILQEAAKKLEESSTDGGAFLPTSTRSFAPPAPRIWSPSTTTRGSSTSAGWMPFCGRGPSSRKSACPSSFRRPGCRTSTTRRTGRSQRSSIRGLLRAWRRRNDLHPGRCQ